MTCFFKQVTITSTKSFLWCLMMFISFNIIILYINIIDNNFFLFKKKYIYIFCCVITLKSRAELKQKTIIWKNGEIILNIFILGFYWASALETFNMSKYFLNIVSPKIFLWNWRSHIRKHPLSVVQHIIHRAHYF